MTSITLNDGNKIPAVGFGVFLIPGDGPAYEAVRTALDAGYRHIDTAAAYFNEADVGRAVKDSGIPRKEIFITSKLWLGETGHGLCGPLPAPPALWRCSGRVEGARGSQGSGQDPLHRRQQHDAEDLE